MARKRAETFDLAEAISDRGFTPRADDLPRLLELLGDDDETRAENAERALASLGAIGSKAARDAFPNASTKARVGIVRAIGRRAEDADDSERAFVASALDDGEPRVRRAAANALGKIGGEAEEAILVARLKSAPATDLARAIASSLGKIGGKSALAALTNLRDDDRELTRVANEARTKIERTLGRGTESGIDPTRQAPKPLDVVFHCRGGLEEILREEIDPALAPRIARAAAVEATLRGPMKRLQAPRTALRFGFPLPTREGSSSEAALVEAMTSDVAHLILSTFSRGTVRYRIEWAGAGHRRAATFAAAGEIARVRPALINDPTRSPWEVIVVEGKRGAFVELWPRGLRDDRFAWRRAEVQGASHPTIAAAIARIAGARADDVVWDPFCGGGAELVERALLGPTRLVFGTDLDPRSIDAARANLDAARVKATLAVADARSHRLAASPSAIVSNPPMGRRVLRGSPAELADLLRATLRNVASQLAPKGRIVWLSPLPDATAALASELALRTTLRRRVDLGGFSAELQRFDRV